MAHVTDYGFGISAIDSGYQRPLLAAIHLVVEGGRAAVIETGVNSSAPRVLAALRDQGLRPEQVDYVTLTHIHLDHAGGAGLLLTVLPNARLTVHPRGAPHLVDPRKLIESAIAVYGEPAVRRTYGDIVPVPRSRIIETAHESAGVTEIVLGEAQRYGWTLSRDRVLSIFADDIELNAQGLAIWLDATTGE